MSQRFIIHLDMDAFFASVEARDNPALRDKPVIIGADPKGGKGRGVVSTCSYEARKFGIHSAMPISYAWQKCPQGVFIAPDMEKYSRVSERVFEIFYEFTPRVEAVGIDEAFLDITHSFHLFNTPRDTGLLLKERIRHVTGLSSSIGLAPTKMAAKIASDLKKPDGFVEVTQQGLQDFLRPLSIEKMWGLGKKSAELLRAQGIKTFGELARAQPQDVVRLLGKTGYAYWESAHGIDERAVEVSHETKSISQEHTFDVDTIDTRHIESALMRIADAVAGRLRRSGLKAKTITLKIRLQGFITYTRACTLDAPTDLTDCIYAQAKKLFHNFITHAKPVRLVGIKASHFAQENQLSFFGKDMTKKENLEKAVDKVRKKFGDQAIGRGSTACARRRQK